MHRAAISILGTLFTTTILLQPLVNAQQLLGSIVHAGADGDGVVLVTVENNSSNNFSIESRNNLFDNYNPWQPLTVTTIGGTAVSLVGAEYSYGQLDDASFVPMPAGAVWQRELNLTSYLPMDLTVTKPTSKCYAVTFPNGFWALNTDNLPAGENLATEFLSQGSSRLVDLSISSKTLHLNLTAVPASDLNLAASSVRLLQLVATTAAIPQQPAATEVLGSQTIGISPIQTYGTSIDEYDNAVFGQ